MAIPMRDPNRAPTHPGAILREDVLPATGLTATALAQRLGVSRQTVHALLAERSAVTPEMAVRLGRLCGNGPGIWLRLQQARDLWHAQRTVDISAIEPVEAA